MKWWWRLLTQHELFRALGKITLFNVAILCLWFLPMILRLILIFALGGVSFVAGFSFSIIILLQYKKADIMPNYGTVGNAIVQFGGILFTAGLLVPSIIAFKILVSAPVSVLSYWLTFTFFYPVVAFYLMSHRGYVTVTSTNLKSRRKDDMIRKEVTK